MPRRVGWVVVTAEGLPLGEAPDGVLRVRQSATLFGSEKQADGAVTRSIAYWTRRRKGDWWATEYRKVPVAKRGDKAKSVHP